MNREIKFRFWNSHLKAMYYENGNLMRTLIDGDGYSFIWALGKHYETPKDITIQQFTDVTDKNGKEIYEGDIVEYTWPNGSKLSGFVEFIAGMYVISFPDQTDSGPIGFLKTDNMEIVGSIFEETK